ncbi:YetF domain-containing protein [Paenibacillus oleatilyticus]|uniref:YetF domain-containing protein n=2 Tax=Paenibacillus TaxID=44249 RepID=A0ABV4V5V9_9BACL
MDTIWQYSIRTLLGFIVLLLLTRLLGKKQLSQMTFFTYITGIALGNIAGEMVVNKEIKVVAGITAMTIWALLTIMIEQLSLKSPMIRVLLDGEPAIVIKKGKIQVKAMALSKLNMDDLSMLLRDKNVFSIREVDYAILEPNGKLSVLKKEEAENPTKKDLQLPVQERLYLPTELIADGKIVKKNLKELQLNREWLEEQIKRLGAQSIQEVFFAELQSDGSIFLDKKSNG